MRIYFTLITLLICLITFAQKATLTGQLTDKDMSNEPLAFANVIIKGTSIGTTTDLDGKYTLNVDPGQYVVEFSFLGYESMTETIILKTGEKKVINKNMTAGSGVMLQDVVIATSRKRNTEAAIMLEVKEAKQVVNAISAEQISKGVDANAAQAIQRVPGITIVEGRFVMVRGLSERYNNVLVNNSVAPSTEVDKRTFSFDLIPSNALDKMVIYKTGSAELPGDFAGGIIKLTTSENIEEFTRVGFNVGYRVNTTFKDYYQSEGSNTDFLGFDNSFRPLPSNFPSANDINFNPAIGVAAAHSLPNNFNPERSTAFLDSGFGFSLGRNISLKNNKRLMTVNSLSYSNNFLTYNRQFNRYFALQEGQDRPQDWFRFVDNVNENEVKLTFLSNWMLRLNENNVIKFKNLFNQIGENTTILRTGLDFQQRANEELQNYLLGYRNRTIYVGQFEGEHQLAPNQQLSWVAGLNYMTENEPDLRRFRTFRPLDQPDANFTMIDPASSNLFDTGRYFGELTEYAVNNGANYTYTIERIKNDEELAPIKFKAGYYFDYKKRTFDSRYVSYFIPSYITPERGNEIKQLPLTEIFSPEYVNTVDGWLLREGTRVNDSYQASNLLTAGYAQAEMPFGRFDITTGLRVEHNIQKLEKPEVVENPITSFLPSINIGYNLNEKSLFRLAYSRTVNRPEFREIAPFLFYSYELDAGITGNTNLKTATIDNLDFRYEFYPNKGETISLGAFYKNFQNPIENIVQITTEQPQFLFANADGAYNYGVELELRKSMQDITDNPFISKLSANINASYIYSKVDLGEVTSQDRNRALQGQSPYILNAAIAYDDVDHKFGINMIYNRIGNRIFSVGDVIFPTIYELSRDQIDITISKRFEKSSFKIGVQDLLNSKFQFFEDSNRDNKINKANDNVIDAFRLGTRFTFTVTYDL